MGNINPNPSDRRMKMYMVILGVILLIAGIGGAAYYGFVPRTRVYGAIGVPVVGIAIAALGAMMQTTSLGATTTGKVTCAKRGDKSGAAGAVNQPANDKHV